MKVRFLPVVKFSPELHTKVRTNRTNRTNSAAPSTRAAIFSLLKAIRERYQNDACEFTFLSAYLPLKGGGANADEVRVSREGVILSRLVIHRPTDASLKT